MKLNKWLYGAAVLAIMASCSDNFDDPKNPGTSPVDEGQGYIGINIQLPTVSGTRAEGDTNPTGGNDQFDDGELDEYVVKDAVLYLFQGTTEENAICQGAYNLREADPEYVQNGQVTRQSVRVANVKGLNPDNNLYALVIVNGQANGLISETAPMIDALKQKTIKDFQEYITTSTLVQQTKAGKNYGKHIVMLNSPLTESHGGLVHPGEDVSVTVLVRLDKTTYTTQSDAIANPAGVIHVERAVAKVTCSKFTKSTDLTVTIKDNQYKLEVDSIWWDMAQNMAETYLVRNTNRTPVNTTEQGTANLWRWYFATNIAENKNNTLATLGKYRMLGYKEILSPTKIDKTDASGNVVKDEAGNPILETVQKNYYRPYFCQVPNYNVKSKKAGVDPKIYENKTFMKTEMVAKDAILWATSTSDFKGPGAFYPRENTFPVEFMTYANTTRVGFWVKFKFVPQGNAPAIDTKKTNFYINGLNKSTLYLDDDYGHDPLTNLAIAELAAKNEDNTPKYQALWDAIDAAVDKGEGQAGSVSGIVLDELLKFTPAELGEDDKDDGEVVIGTISFKTYEDLTAEYPKYKDIFKENTVPSYDFSELITRLNTLGQFYKYDGGKVFYEARIKHFGDDLTPWDVDDSLIAATDIDESYGNIPKGEITKLQRDQNYLGRYGIVRNNWYDLEVKKIAHIGYPKDPASYEDTWPGKPDDNKDQYIAVELRVLSWAKRSQEVEF